MSLFSRLRARILPPHHRLDPRLHTDPEIEDSWIPGSTAIHISEFDKQWINTIIAQASVFPLDCFIRFEYVPTRKTVICYRVERRDLPKLDLGMTSNVDEKQWKYLWRFLYDHFDSSLKIQALEGERRREFIVWISPKKNRDPYSVNPNAVSIKLCIEYPCTSDYNTPWCGLDGPCTAH